MINIVVRDIVKVIGVWYEQDAFYHQVRVLKNEPDQYLKVKTPRNKYEFYRGTSPRISSPIRFFYREPIDEPSVTPDGDPQRSRRDENTE